jgi:hypothetical protein
MAGLATSWSASKRTGYTMYALDADQDVVD